MKRLVLIVFILGFAVYGWSLRNSFMGDDLAQIVNNPVIQSLENIPQLFSGGTFYRAGFTKLQGGYYRPLPMTVYTMIYAVVGLNPLYYHLIQIIFHLLNVLLIYLLLAKFTNRIAAYLLSLFYLVHPINVETVVYIANLQDVLFVFFGLLGFLILTGNALKFKQRLILAVFCLFLSFLSKETGIVFLPLYWYYLRNKSKSQLKLFTRLGLLFFGAYLGLRFQAIGFNYHQSTIFPVAKASLPLRILNIPPIIWHYFKTLIFPKDLFVMQEWLISSPQQPVIYLSWLFSLVMIYLVARTAQFIKTQSIVRYQTFRFFALIFILGMIIHLQVIPLDATVSDRWFYLPFIGLLGMLGVLFAKLQLTPNRRFGLLVSYLVIFCLLSVRSVIRINDWRTSETLYTHDLSAKNPSFILENQMGEIYLQNRQYDKAEKFIRLSIAQVPDWGSSWYSLGNVFAAKYESSSQAADLNQAFDAYQNAVKYGGYPDGYEAKARIEVNLGDLNSARNTLDQGLRQFPHHGRLIYLLSAVEFRAGDYRKALTLAKNAVQTYPTQETQAWYQYLSAQILQPSK